MELCELSVDIALTEDKWRGVVERGASLSIQRRMRSGTNVTE